MTTPLPTTGNLRFSQIRANLEIPAGASLSLGDPRFRALINKKTGQIKMSDFRGSNELELNITANQPDPPGTHAGFYRSFWGTISTPNIDGIPVVGVYDAKTENKFVLSLEGNIPRSAFRAVMINNVIFYESDVTTHSYSAGPNTTDWTWNGLQAGLVVGQTYEFSYMTGPDTATPLPPEEPPPTPPDPIPTDVPMPSLTAIATPSVSSGQTLDLLSGQTYFGTLDLQSKTNITVRALGQNGPAIITLGKTVPNADWVLHAGNIYKAAVPAGITPKVVSNLGAIVPHAHTGTIANPWKTGVTASGNSCTIDTQGQNVIGGEVVVLLNQSVCAFPALITGQSGNNLTVSHYMPDSGFTGFSMGQGYLQGKLWMLTASTEPGWAEEGGFIYIRTPSGNAPSYVVVAGDGTAINAYLASNITLQNVSVRDCGYGITTRDSNNIRINDGGYASTIRNCRYDGIRASGMNNGIVRHIRGQWFGNNGFHSWYLPNTTVDDCHFLDVAAWGMPSNCYGGIYASSQVNVRITNNRVERCGYHGIAMMELSSAYTNNGSLLEYNVVDGACLKLYDGGGIYTINRPKTAMNMIIRFNTVRNMDHHAECIGIYLDDSAPFVTVDSNTVENCWISCMVHDGRDNVIISNIFDNAVTHHVGMLQSLGFGTMRNNYVTNNTFKMRRNEKAYNCESGTDNNQFCRPNLNTYIYYGTSQTTQFARTWDGGPTGVDHTFQGWRNFQQAGGTGYYDQQSVVQSADAVIVPNAVVAQTMLNDMTLAHDAYAHGVNPSWGWGSGPVTTYGVNFPTDYPDPHVVPWGVVASAASGNPATNVRVQIRKVILDVKRSGVWSRIAFYTNDSQIIGALYTNYETNTTAPANLRNHGFDGISVKLPVGGGSFHFYTSSRFRVAFGAQEIVIRLEARMILDDTGLPDDRSTAKILANSAGDVWRSATQTWNGAGSNADFVIGRFKWVTNDWQSFTSHTLANMTEVNDYLIAEPNLLPR